MQKGDESTRYETGPQEKRGFWGYCAAVLRWVLVLFFGLRLVFGIYVGASWKELLLYAVPLLLLTVVPRPWRKVGWGLVVLVLIGSAVWIFLPERETGNWQPVYDAEINAINEKYGVPDDENAAVYYAQIKPTDFSDSTDSGPTVWDPNDTTLHRPWTADEFPEMAAWLQIEQEKIAPFWQAVQYERCWFPIQTDPNSMYKRRSHIGILKQAASVIQRSIYLDLGNNDIPAATTKCSGLLQCSAHLQQQVPVLDKLLCGIIFLRTTEIIRDMAVSYPLDGASINNSENAVNLVAFDWNEYVRDFIELDKAELKYSAGFAFKMSEKDDASESSEAFFGMVDAVYAQLEQKLLQKDFDYLKPDNWLKKLKTKFDSKRIVNYFLEIQLEELKNQYRQLQQIQTYKQGTLIMLALRQYFNEHGQWPDSLAVIEAELPEGVLSNRETGWEFMYYRPKNSDSFVLYSYGGDDDSYRQTRDRPWISSEVGLDDILIWPEEREAVPGVE